jgi:Rrf2 family protein
MRITLSRRGDYAVRAMLALAEHEEPTAYLSARRIADRTNIPASFAPHVLADLVRAGLVTGSPGRSGGYRLAHPAASITLLRVIDASGGEPAPPRCVLRGIPCDAGGRCAVHDTIAGATDAARAALAQMSMADLVRGRTLT